MNLREIIQLINNKVISSDEKNQEMPILAKSKTAPKRTESVLKKNNKFQSQRFYSEVKKAMTEESMAMKCLIM